MSKQARGLGRGLDSLIRNTAVEENDDNEKVKQLELNEIVANDFNQEKNLMMKHSRVDAIH